MTTSAMAPSTVSKVASAARSQQHAKQRGTTIRVAFQGELGAYGDQAIAQHWHGAATASPSESFEDVVIDVVWGWVDYGIIPVWNTVVGDIEPGRSAVRLAKSAAHGLVVAGDTHVAVHHQLLALPGSTMDDLDCVASHPVALAQCKRFLLAHPNIVPTPVYDTAGAARDLSTHGRKTSAAIASHHAAERYGLIVLAEDIQDVPHNTTRFLVLARPGDQRIPATVPEAGGPVRW
jgi:prephenate dehydratase